MREREKKKKPQRLCATKLRLKKKLLLPHWDGPGELCWTPLSASTPKISSADPPKELLSLHPDSLLHEDVSPSWTSSSSQGKATWQPPCCFALRVRVTLAAGKIRTLPCAGSLLLKNLPQLFVGKAQHSLAEHRDCQAQSQRYPAPVFLPRSLLSVETNAGYTSAW